MVIDRQDFLVHTALLEIQSAVDNQIHRLAALFMVQVVCDHRRTTTAIHQMIEAHTVNIFGFEQVKNRIQILHIVTRNREAQPVATQLRIPRKAS